MYVVVVRFAFLGFVSDILLFSCSSILYIIYLPVLIVLVYRVSREYAGD